ncbi:MAG TPA: ABC transporter substrate-binding protein/permease [Thermoanaerobaculia bacterium]|nr:ABC transporter substrate-binding protein/permease [Thermoanaerobaculia bacterium]
MLAAALGGPLGAAPPELRWGGDQEGGAPFVEADPDDPSKLRGFDVEIASELGRRMGRVPRFVQVAYSSIDQSVDRGDFEIGFSGVEDTPGRRAALSVTVPYYEFREVLSTRAGEEKRFPTLASLRGRRVGTLGGTIAFEILLAAEKEHGITAVSYDDDVHPYEDVVKGRLDAVLLDHVLALRALTRTGSLAIVPGTVATGWYVGVLAKANAKGRDEVDRHLADMMRDGTLARIFTAWGLEDEAQGKLRARVLAARAEGAVRAEASAAAPGSPSAAAAAAGGSAERRKRTADAVKAYLPALFRAALVTIALSCLSMALAVSFGAIVATGRIYGPRPLRIVLAAWVEVTRGTPVLLQLFVLYYGLSGFVRLPAFLAAVIGLGLNYAAYESEIYRGALEAVGKTQLEAARTLGFTEFQVLRLVRGPLAFRLALAPMTNDFVALLKDSSLVSVITVVELTKQTSIFAVNLGSWLVPGLLCGSIYLAMSLPLARLARRLEARWKDPS